MSIRTGILGGTFDPIHTGHLQLAKNAMDAFDLDELILMPSGVPAYKEALHQVTPAVHRLAMVKLAAQDCPGMSVSDMEIRREGNTYTADTLEELCRLYPQKDFFFIVGSDSLDYMDRWYHPERIFARTRILVAKRSTQTDDAVLEKIRSLSREFDARIDIIPGAVADLSSTMIRRLAAEGASIRGYVPEKVAGYIERERLYRV